MVFEWDQIVVVLVIGNESSKECVSFSTTVIDESKCDCHQSNNKCFRAPYFFLLLILSFSLFLSSLYFVLFSLFLFLPSFSLFLSVPIFSSFSFIRSHYIMFQFKITDLLDLKPTTNTIQKIPNLNLKTV